MYIYTYICRVWGLEYSLFTKRTEARIACFKLSMGREITEEDTVKNHDGCQQVILCYPPHVPTLFGLEALEHDYFRSRTCIQVPRQSASVQPARTLWTAYGKPNSKNQEFWNCFYSNFRRNAYELNSHPREAKNQGFSEDV